MAVTQTNYNLEIKLPQTGKNYLHFGQENHTMYTAGRSLFKTVSEEIVNS